MSKVSDFPTRRDPSKRGTRPALQRPPTALRRVGILTGDDNCTATRPAIVGALWRFYGADLRARYVEDPEEVCHAD